MVIPVVSKLSPTSRKHNPKPPSVSAINAFAAAFRRTNQLIVASLQARIRAVERKARQEAASVHPLPAFPSTRRFLQ